MSTDRNVSIGSVQDVQSSLGFRALPIQVILYLLTVVLPIGFQAGPLAMTTLRLYLMVLFLPLMINLLRGRYGKIILSDIVFTLYILWTFVSLLVNNPDQVVQSVGSTGIEFLGGYLVGRAYIRTPETFLSLCKWLILLTLATTPFALVETMTGRPLIIEAIKKLPGINSVAIVNIEKRMGLERVQAVFAHPIHYGMYCSVAFSMVFVALREQMRTSVRYLTSAVIVGSGLLALSSGAMLAMVLQFSLILWAAIFAKIRWRWWLLVGLFALGYVVVDLISNRSPIRVFMSYATFSAHNAYWRGIIFEWGMKSVWAHPIYGIGFHDWVRPSFMHSGSMDNFWLVVAVRYGIPAFAFLAVGYISSLYLIMRRNFEGNNKLTLIRLAWVFTFLGLSFTLSTVHIWTNIYSFVFFVFGSGMWLISVPSSDDTDPQRPVPEATEPQNTSPYTRFAHKTPPRSRVV
ncbi:O-antigen ligase family protein [Profundibacter sp.]